MSESTGFAFDLELQVNCNARLIGRVPEDIWLDPLRIEPLAHLPHYAHDISGSTADFDRTRHAPTILVVD